MNINIILQNHRNVSGTQFMYLSFKKSSRALRLAAETMAWWLLRETGLCSHPWTTVISREKRGGHLKRQKHVYQPHGQQTKDKLKALAPIPDSRF